jgi:hypothetical protein
MPDLPVIVLAFANDQDGHRYLRDLPEELRQIQTILEASEGKGLCKLVVRPNAGLDQIFETFTEHRDRVAVFHYGGHAGGDRLLLEATGTQGAVAHAEGLATFLGQRRNLQLVFLNGCSTRAQAAGLLDAGVGAVIATARDIEDTVARDFSVSFYTELTSGATLRAAYEAARGRVRAARGSAPSTYFRTRDLGPTSAVQENSHAEPADDRGFPWELRLRSGAELVERWSLPDAAGNPLFGLPPLPEQDLPESPFRGLTWFTAQDAEVYFGRGHQIREVFKQIKEPGRPPILLLHGASGVGKSSLLDAGLVPRLQASGVAVTYLRRKIEKGLLGSLREAFAPGDISAAAALGDSWRSEEQRLGKPLVVILDQVEEAFTRPGPDGSKELDDLVKALTEALAVRENRPRGKLILGFRKEWFAEVDRRLAEARLPRANLLITALDRRGIIEAIRGPARPGRLLDQYRLVIEDNLPEVIADDLIRNPDAASALAPTLQVLLTNMWKRAAKTSSGEHRFDRVLYESLRDEGYLLKSVLDDGLKAIGLWNDELESSGLALDLLESFTTDLGVVGQPPLSR